MVHQLFGVRIDDISSVDLERLFQAWIRSDKGHVIVTPNAEFLLIAKKRDDFKILLNKSDLALADSVSLRYAVAALTNQYLLHRYPGVDLVERLCCLSEKENARTLFIGGDPGAAVEAAVRMNERFPHLDIQGIDPGQISLTEESILIPQELIQKINALKPNIIAVGLGQVKQERFIFELKNKCPSVRIWIGVGGAFEMISQQKPRAPKYFTRLGFEWLWRVLIEPKRWRRIMNAVIVFPSIVVYSTLRSRTFIQSSLRVFSEILKQIRQI
ncbi:MAG: N-acetylmannosaminyltransferase TagA [Candidatus Uhrbacteria bacterium GW2011_GWF2_39_13]|uniref:N-acetylmannosaminyltransferase TagA n=1 Tax=Candidatus Uhrbacteria bacterium GW2011_GWF2_39_13 TaxID=1618995 RepID=A0A0G0MNE0_9BACT|nr:MAG: N-acetylmannosaminyltransferase TagA [Candidatus Uhrbacteria bacterium GW2011_GWF2_39_13]HAU66599.1 hypothetical protein [Candidatus Uhrbacteria bacterium]